MKRLKKAAANKIEGRAAYKFEFALKCFAMAALGGCMREPWRVSPVGAASPELAVGIPLVGRPRRWLSSSGSALTLLVRWGAKLAAPPPGAPVTPLEESKRELRRLRSWKRCLGLAFSAA